MRVVVDTNVFVSAVDDKFLELAVNGHTDLLVLNPFRSIPIVAPAIFVQSAAHRRCLHFQQFWRRRSADEPYGN